MKTCTIKFESAVAITGFKWPEFGLGIELPKTGPIGRTRSGLLYTYVNTSDSLTYTMNFTRVPVASFQSLLTTYKTNYSEQASLTLYTDLVVTRAYTGILDMPVTEITYDRNGKVSFLLKLIGKETYAIPTPTPTIAEG